MMIFWLKIIKLNKLRKGIIRFALIPYLFICYFIIWVPNVSLNQAWHFGACSENQKKSPWRDGTFVTNLNRKDKEDLHVRVAETCVNQDARESKRDWQRNYLKRKLCTIGTGTMSRSRWCNISLFGNLCNDGIWYKVTWLGIYKYTWIRVWLTINLIKVYLKDWILQDFKAD
jgi:hypothetical protein